MDKYEFLDHLGEGKFGNVFKHNIKSHNLMLLSNRIRALSMYYDAKPPFYNIYVRKM